jgi:hypothetical protein
VFCAQKENIQPICLCDLGLHVRNYCFCCSSLALVMLMVWAEKGGEGGEEGIQTGLQLSSRLIGFKKTLKHIEFAA